MLLLTIDTSGKNGSLALARVAPDQPAVEILDAAPLAGGTFSAQLIPQVSSLLTKHGCTKTDLDGFVVVSGPGSFTGLRVGLAAIKALAEALKKPIAAVSLLEAVARSASASGRVLAALDAGRGEIYVGDYSLNEGTGGRAVVHSERLLSRSDFLAEAKGQVLVTTDAALTEMLTAAGIDVERVAYPSSELIAAIGWQRIELGLTVSPEALEANYIRRSDAEIFSQPKH